MWRVAWIAFGDFQCACLMGHDDDSDGDGDFIVILVAVMTRMVMIWKIWYSWHRAWVGVFTMDRVRAGFL